MTIDFVREHDTTKGPEAHQTYLFDITADKPGPNHFPSVFEHEGVKYRAFRTHSQVAPIVKDGKRVAVARVVAVKCDDERKWMLEGRHGKSDPAVLEGYIAR